MILNKRLIHFVSVAGIFVSAFQSDRPQNTPQETALTAFLDSPLVGFLAEVASISALFLTYCMHRDYSAKI